MANGKVLEVSTPLVDMTWGRPGASLSIRHKFPSKIFGIAVRGMSARDVGDSY
ncbi:hypothetical protein CY34DRAFT_804420 [Suillus luteus UH-Slu-Lm8-n1]|uniref:Unplaced genomic scaffold CY34scaffold_96, whole genome shotgun sequence n=1 Tax=Suillus luteus UH-Slu-Lm8-n1 TaxID=930992 RepID=A0A0C9ZYS2_9AGAM|nr:hypothetical protein CY34DRAFT_804420 [Suillus luteus UH-Slu-Lm8-n1]